MRWPSALLMEEFEMLVLSRRLNEALKIGNDITVTVVRIAHDKVQLGISAPPDVLVLREELEPIDTPEVREGTVH